MLTIRKDKYSLTMKNMKLGTKESRFTTERTEDTEIKNLSQRIYAGRPHKYTDSMYYLHFLHELHGENGCSLCSQCPQW